MKKIFLSLVIVFISTTAMASGKPIQLSLTPDIALYDRSEKIEGLILSIWGENQQAALALGIVNGSKGDSAGLSLGFILNYADSYLGLHFAPVNYTRNYFFGVQLGCVNYAKHLKGVQLGFINYADNVQASVQIGLLNIIAQIFISPYIYRTKVNNYGDGKLPI